MKNKMNIKILAIVLLSTYATVFGQQDRYQYKRAVSDVSTGWQRIDLPNDIYHKIARDFADIRIMGILANSDTIKVPYLLESARQESLKKFVSFKKINTSWRKGRYYMTFKINTDHSINRIEMDLEVNNYDIPIRLEGSNDQKEWFIIADKYRILSIDNAQMNYHFSDIIFPDAKYEYFRISAADKKLINTKRVGIYQVKNSGNTLKTYTSSLKEVSAKDKSQSYYILSLKDYVPVSQVSFVVNNPNDYYRHFTIQFLADSIQTPKGWRYQYRNVSSGVLNSIENNSFSFSEKMTNKIKVIVNNGDNEPLKIENISVRGYAYFLVARFDKPANFFLTYGNPKAGKPQYDLIHFKKKIPKNLPVLHLGNETKLDYPEAQKTTPLFVDEKWLWAIMSIIIVVLAWFSLKMLRKTEGG